MMRLKLTEVNDNETTNAEETVHRVQPPFDRLLKRRGDESDDEIEEPVGCSGQRHPLRPNTQRHNLWWVQPRNWTPAVSVVSK